MLERKLMPTTLAGFLLVSGLLMFIFSLLRGRFEYKDIIVPTVGPGGKWALRFLGLGFMIVSGALFYLSPPIPMEPPSNDASVAVREWLYLFDREKYTEVWAKSAKALQLMVTETEFTKMAETDRKPLRRVVGRAPIGDSELSVLPDGQQGPFRLYSFRTTFASGEERAETVLAVREVKVWKIQTYQIAPISK